MSPNLSRLLSLGLLALMVAVEFPQSPDPGPPVMDATTLPIRLASDRVGPAEGVFGPFVANRGQFPDETVVAASIMGKIQATIRAGSFSLRPATTTGESLGQDSRIENTDVTLRFGSSSVEPVLEGMLQTRFSFLFPASRGGESRDVPSYSRALYQDVWPGIDLRILQNRGGPKYEFLVGRGALPETIRVDVDGAERLVLAPDGSLQIHGHGFIITDAPVVTYQEGAEPSCSYALLGQTAFGFSCERYRVDAGLTIDPALSVTGFNGSMNDDIAAVAFDPVGRVVFAGSTSSPDMPGADGTYRDSRYSGAPEDAFVAVLSADLSTLYWATYFGGSGDDAALGVGTNPDGDIIVAGYTDSLDLPTTPGSLAPQALGERDGFVARLDANGTALAYCSYFGGTGADTVESAEVTEAGIVYLGGYTDSPDLPVTPTAFQSSLITGATDGFASVINASNGSLVFSSYVGSPGEDRVQSLAPGPDGILFAAGITNSPSFATTAGSLHPSFLGTTWQTVFNYFLIAIETGNGTPRYGTFIMGYEDNDRRLLIAPESDGSVSMVGQATGSYLNATENALQPDFAGGYNDGFVARLDPTGATFEMATYLGGSGKENPTGIDLDGTGGILVVGATESTDFPTTGDGAQMSSGGTWDGFIALIDRGGESLEWSSYIGGETFDHVMDCARSADGEDFAFVGYTSSASFPLTPGTFQDSRPPAGAGENNSEPGGFVAVFDPSLGNMSVAGSPPLPQIVGITVDGRAATHVTAGQRVSLEVSLTPPSARGLSIEWRVDGAKIGSGLRVSEVVLGRGDHEIEVRVANATDYATRSFPMAGDPPENPSDAPRVETPALEPAQTAGVVIIVVGAVALASSEIGIWVILGALLGALMPRLRSDTILSHFARGRLYQLIKDEPGINFSGLRGRAELSNGAVVYHLRVLEKGGYVRVVRKGLLTCYYPTDVKITRETYRLSPEDHDLVAAVTKAPGISPSDLAAGLGRSRSSVSKTVRKLASLGIVTAQRRGGRVRLFARRLDEPEFVPGEIP